MADDVNSLPSPIIFSEEHGDDEINFEGIYST
jgi:hypothetical protein